MSKVSVIVPVYNGAETISKTLESVLAQTYKDIEIIVVNDGSTDDTLSVISAFEKDRVRVFSQKNSGAPAARNYGLAQAKGDYISFIDADDLWSKDKVESQVAVLDHSDPKVGVVYSWTALIDSKDTVFSYLPKKACIGDVYKRILTTNFLISGSNAMIRKVCIDQVGGMDTSLKYTDDWDFFIRLASVCHFSVVPKYQIYYRQSNTSITAQVSKSELGSLDVIEKAFNSAPEEFQDLRPKAVSNIYLYSGKQLLSYDVTSDKAIKALGKILAALKLNPAAIFSTVVARLIVKSLIIIVFPHSWNQYILNFRKKTDNLNLQEQ